MPGYPGNNNLAKMMIEEGTVPKEVEDYDATRCRTCQLIHPWRRPVPKTAECSDSTVVQVDYMPMGQHEKGWRDEIGAYIFSSRASKVPKDYSVTIASAEDAPYSLEKYFMYVLPLLREVECVQTDAGGQFNSQRRKNHVNRGLTHRAFSADHQAMNSQVERIVLFAQDFE